MSEPQRQSLLLRFPALRRLAMGGVRRRIPVVEQLSGSECGAACLAMVLGYHGKAVRLDELRDAATVGRDGMTALSLLETARAYGLRGRGVRVDVDELELLEPGAILHWEFRHFVVFEALRRDAVDLVDPASGRRRVPLAAFRRSFTGVAVLLEPGEDFETRSAAAGPVWRNLSLLEGHGGLLARVLAASAFLPLFALAVPSLTGAVVDRVVPRGDGALLVMLGAGLLSLALFHFLTSLVRAHLLLHLRTRFDARMSLGFLEHLVNLPFAFFQVRSTGDLVSRANSNGIVRELLTSGALSGLLDGTLVCTFLLVLFAASPSLGALAVLLGLAQVAVFLLTKRRQQELSAHSLEVESASQSYLVELLNGMQTLKGLGAERRAVERWSHLYVDVLNVSLDRGRLAALVEALLGALKLASPLAILCVGAHQVLQGRLSLGAMLGLSALANAFLTPLSALVTTALQLQLLGSYLRRIRDVLDAAPEQASGQVRPAHEVQGGITLERVSFSYGPRVPLVVREVSVSIQPGQFVAIVGRSGAGKTTLAHLLLGMCLPTSGRILYDGVDLTTLDLRAVRRQLGIVMQNPYLFRGSIRSNIALADPALPLEDVVRAAKLAQVHEDIAAMPMGYETQLSEMGGAISGGQRQRIALARALATRPSVLLLDEATNALDTLTERRVQDALAGLQCTRIVIAHRLSTVEEADLVLVMDGGRLVESGTPAQLLARGGTYASLVHAPTDAAVTRAV